ncbi:unnamed protein product [Hyaloperonospora brassicae]|uniref:Guanylate cyclase domain-containing protein n=1 Tax=Hyaloperonospora brassicae TaxID=162125 RepID=A0AAV0T3G0_HYABA|nr:unnamed protein product [Hyaloperonospora brassicae]
MADLTYTVLGLASLVLSNLSTALVTVKLYRAWDYRVSCVRWLFLTFFAYLWLSTVARGGVYVWTLVPLLSRPDVAAAPLPSSALDATSDMRAPRPALPTLVLSLCDVLHFAAALWALPLTYELSKIAAKSMDRGTSKEQAKIRMYLVVGHAAIAAFAAAEAVLSVLGGGYSRRTYRLALGVYALQLATLVYMGVALFALKRRGRDVESINGRFEASPVYQRLQRMLCAYALCALQYECASLVMAVTTDARRSAWTLHYLELSHVLYNATGCALALATGCSLPCTLRVCGCCCPDELLVQLVVEANRPHVRGAHKRSKVVAAPVCNPVFVVTDIESSSALWAIGDAKVMQRAIQVHDDTLRALLALYRGYEITTAGDSFQLAFHTIREAVAYCLDVQLQLLAAPWPKDLHGLVAATKKLRVGHRVVFRGLRVRMGVHDAMGSDGHLHQSPHAVTGKTVYTGAAEVLAAEVSDVGAGGQIVITRRIAEWLMANRDALPRDFRVTYLCDYLVPHVNMHVAVYEVLPDALSQRQRIFAKDQHKRIPQGATDRSTSGSSGRQSSLGTPIGSPTSWFFPPDTPERGPRAVRQ